VNHGAVSVEHLWLRLVDVALFLAPSGAFHEHTNAVETIFGSGDSFSIFVCIVHNHLIKCQCVNGDRVFTRVILECASQETVGEEEFVDPVDVGDSVINPILEECKSDLDILDVTSEGPKRVEPVFDPHSWN